VVICILAKERQRYAQFVIILKHISKDTPTKYKKYKEMLDNY
jgi:hypothetical protein